MRLLLELVVAAGIIVLGWDKPIKDWLPSSKSDSPKTADHPRSSIHNPRPSPVSGSWMWDPNHKTALDRPSPTPRSKEEQ